MTLIKSPPRPGTPEWWAQRKGEMADRHGREADKMVIKVLPGRYKIDKADPFLFTAQITKQVIDRDREVVMPEGGRLQNFDRGGAVHWMHDFSKPVAIPRDVKHVGNTLVSSARFMEREDGMVGEFFPDFARAFVNQMIKAGKMPGVSIGFEPLEQRRATKGDKEQFGDGVQLVTSKWDLLEWSIASVPCNPEAFVTTIGKSLGLSQPAVKSLFYGVDLPAKSVEPAPEPPQVVAAIGVVPRRKRVGPVLVYMDPPKKKAKSVRREDPQIVVAKKVAQVSGEMYI